MGRAVGRILVLLCLCSCLSLPGLAGKKVDQLKEQIATMSDELVQATLQSDVEKVLSFYTDDAMSMPNYSALLDGKESIAEHQENMRAAGVKFRSLVFNTLDVWKCGDLVYEIGEYDVSLTSPQTPAGVTDHGAYMTVYRREGRKSLKVKAEIWNTSRSPWARRQTAASAEEAAESTEAKEYRELVRAKERLNEMLRDLRQRSVIGLDGEWDSNVGGYRVTGFAEGNTAAAAGVRVGDVFFKVNGIPLVDRKGSQEDAPNRQVGQDVEITVLRDGVEHTMTVTLIAMSERMIAEELGKFLIQNYLD